MATHATVRDLAALLGGGERRSLGRSGEVVDLACAHPELLPQLIALLSAEDRLVAIRAIDVLEKVQRRLPAKLFRAFRRELLSLAPAAEEPELRWHLAQMLPRLPLSKGQRARAVAVLDSYLRDRSVLVRVFALEAIVELAIGTDDSELQATARRQIERAMRGSAAERARARLLLGKFFEIGG